MPRSTAPQFGQRSPESESCRTRAEGRAQHVAGLRSGQYGGPTTPSLSCGHWRKRVDRPDRSACSPHADQRTTQWLHCWCHRFNVTKEGIGVDAKTRDMQLRRVNALAELENISLGGMRRCKAPRFGTAHACQLLCGVYESRKAIQIAFIGEFVGADDIARVSGRAVAGRAGGMERRMTLRSRCTACIASNVSVAVRVMATSGVLTLGRNRNTSGVAAERDWAPAVRRSQLRSRATEPSNWRCHRSAAGRK